VDLVRKKLAGGDKTAFRQLVYALVKTEQFDYAKMLDDQLTEEYLHKRLETG